MNINNELKSIIKVEVLKKKSLDAAKEYANVQRPIVRREIEIHHEEKRLMEMFDSLECN